MPERSEIESLIITSVRMLAHDFEIEALTEATASSSLYGEDGPLDSMALVNLIADIEDAVAEKFDVTVMLADERAMSAKRSPFRSVASLTDAIIERMHQ